MRSDHTHHLVQLPTTSDDDSVLVRPATTPAEAYELGYMDGAAMERERLEYRIELLTARLRVEEDRYMSLLKAAADCVAMQPKTVVIIEPSRMRLVPSDRAQP